MDQTKALNAILESADLISMLEELANASARGGMTSIAGLRITLRNIREQLLASHDCLAPVVLSRETQNAEAAQRVVAPQNQTIITQRPGEVISRNGNSGENQPFTRKDLRATIERVLENS